MQSKKEKILDSHVSILQSTFDSIDDFNESILRLPENPDLYFIKEEELRLNLSLPHPTAVEEELKMNPQNKPKTPDEINKEVENSLLKINAKALEFWDEISTRFTPTDIDSTKKKIGKGLKQLRLNYLLFFFCVNLLWVLISVGVDVFELSMCTQNVSNCTTSIQEEQECLVGYHCCIVDDAPTCCPDPECYNILGLIFLIVFGFLLVISFLSEIIFAIETLVQYSIPQPQPPKSPWEKEKAE